MKKFLLAVVLFVAVFCSFQLTAADRVGTAHESFSPETVCNIMKRTGYSVSIDKDGDILWKLDGYKTCITFYKENRSIQFFVNFSDPSATLEKHNQFNMDYRFCRSVMPKAGSARLELDLDFAGGITEERLVDFLKTCQLAFSKWRDKVLR